MALRGRYALPVVSVLLPALLVAEPLAITGRILDPDGRPAAGAEVWLVRHVWLDYSDESNTCLARAVSGADGVFRLPPVDLHVRNPWTVWDAIGCYRPGYAFGFRSIAYPYQVGDLSLRRPVPIRVTVRAPGAAPDVGKVFVRLWSHPGTGDRFWMPPELIRRFWARADADGVCTLNYLPEQTNLGGTAVGPGGLQERFFLTGNLPMTVTLRPGLIVRGVVEGPAGEIAGRKIVFREPAVNTDHMQFGYGEAFTDARGRFTLAGLPARRYDVGVSNGKTGQWLARRLYAIAIAPGCANEFHIALERAYEVSGCVVEKTTGQPAAHTTLCSEMKEGSTYVSVRTAGTDGAGRYRFFLLPGPQRLSAGPRFNPDGYRVSVREVVVTPSTSPRVEDFELLRESDPPPSRP
jgi:5-hydroxyisourate hydrolase-like protein (transthyretin family)